MRSNGVTEPVLICDTNLSRGWARVLLRVLDNPGTEISPLVLSLTGFDADGYPAEDRGVRKELDTVLAELKYWDVETVAFTIFPQQYWRLCRGDRTKLFPMYQDAFPRLQAMNRKDNRRGLYFERLTMFGSGPCEGNQLEWIIQEYTKRKGVRRSAFQATTFDPARDHLPDAQLGFPCLQHMSFVPSGDELVVNAFYATQQLFDKAYGNYLGLSHLGAFMATQMGLRLARLNVTVGVAKLERVNKSELKHTAVVSAARTCVADAEMVRT